MAQPNIVLCHKSTWGSGCSQIGERHRVRIHNSSGRSKQEEISPGCSLDGLMLKLKLQYFGHLMHRVDSLEKTLMLGGIGGRKRRGRQRMRSVDEGRYLLTSAPDGHRTGVGQV